MVKEYTKNNTNREYLKVKKKNFLIQLKYMYMQWKTFIVEVQLIHCTIRLLKTFLKKNLYISEIPKLVLSGFTDLINS